jgi:hypothetical protein
MNLAIIKDSILVVACSLEAFPLGLRSCKIYLNLIRTHILRCCRHTRIPHCQAQHLHYQAHTLIPRYQIHPRIPHYQMHTRIPRYQMHTRIPRYQYTRIPRYPRTSIPRYLRTSVLRCLHTLILRYLLPQVLREEMRSF